MRTGQLTVWVILSALVMLMLALLYVRVSSTEKRVTEFVKVGQQWDVPAVQGFIQSCLNKVATEAVFYFGMVGDLRGPSAPPADFFTGQYFRYDDKFQIPYYFMNGRSLLPTPAQAGVVLSRYMDAQVPRCTKGFSDVRGFDIREQPPKTKVIINEKTLDFSMTYPVTLTRGQQSTALDEFSFRLPSRLHQILNIAKIVVERELADQDIVYWDFLVDVTRLGYNMTAHAERDNTIIYRIVDPASLIYFEPFVFQFANKVGVRG